MNIEQTEHQASFVSTEKLLALVRAMMGGSRGREGDDQPLPPGPWDPVIRVAIEKVNAFGPHPEPWNDFISQMAPWQLGFGNPVPWKVALASILAKHPEIFDALGGSPGFGDEVALNPQPLPPRAAFMVSVAQALISRAELLQEFADAIGREGEEQGIIIVSGYISRFVDDFCDTGYRLKYPFPGPRPRWFADELDGIDLVVMATQFDQAAKEAFHPELRQSLANASLKLVEAGFSRMES
jgi:hypothetical protein